MYLYYSSGLRSQTACQVLVADLGRPWSLAAMWQRNHIICTVGRLTGNPRQSSDNLHCCMQHPLHAARHPPTKSAAASCPTGRSGLLLDSTAHCAQLFSSGPHVCRWQLGGSTACEPHTQLALSCAAVAPVCAGGSWVEAQPVNSTLSWRTALQPGTSCVQVAAGWKHSLGMANNGRVLAWGWGGAVGTSSGLLPSESEGGQLGTGSDFDAWEPVEVHNLAHGGDVLSNDEYRMRWRAVQVACGFQHSAAIVEVI